MAHYAILNDKNIVTQVVIGKDETEPLPEGIASWEEYYGGKRCSYNTTGNSHELGGTPFRGNYPAPGYIYDEYWDAFYEPQPFPSWKMNYDKFMWEAPLPKPLHEPEDTFIYRWSEVNKEWVKVNL